MRFLLVTVSIGASLMAQEDDRGGLLVRECDDGPFCADAAFEVRFADGRSTFTTIGSRDSRIPASVYLDTDQAGIQGWSYFVEHDPAVLSIVEGSATIEGTAAHDFLREPAFVTVVDANFPRGRSGLLAAVVLSFLEDVTLPAGDHEIARVDYHVEAQTDSKGTTLSISDAPVDPEPVAELNITIGGEAYRPSMLRHGIVVVEDSATFARGDTNGDGGLDISDVVLLVRITIGQIRPRFDCEDALDIDDDGGVNISDAIALVQWLFQRGPRPPPPFDKCGVDELCRESSPACQ